MRFKSKYVKPDPYVPWSERIWWEFVEYSYPNAQFYFGRMDIGDRMYRACSQSIDGDTT